MEVAYADAPMTKQCCKRHSKHFLPSIVVLSLLWPLCLGAAPPVSDLDRGESTRIDGVKSLGLESIPGSMPAYYSPHAEARARYLQDILGGQIAYYADVFDVRFGPIALAVLDAPQWPRVAGDEPFGMPSVDGTRPAVVVMPASWDEVTWMVVPKRAEVPPGMLRRALVNGRKWDQVKFEGCDGIGTHEVGHFVIRQLGIEPQIHWFSEFLASYAGYAYLKARHPEQALSNEIFWIVALKNSPHRFTKLDDFESKYDELQQKYPGNYGWYQLALDQRVIEVFNESGLNYLLRIRQEFPTGAPALDSAQLLDKLEMISAGWRAWSLRLEASNVKASDWPAHR
jgi:hypothetical protein